MDQVISWFSQRTGWFWCGLLAGFFVPILGYLLVQAGQGALADREARQLAESYTEADSESFRVAGQEFADELVEVFDDLSSGEVSLYRELWHSRCEGTQQKAHRYDAMLRGEGYENFDEMHEVIEEIDAQLSAAPEWSVVGHDPPEDTAMGGWETWSYEWEHEGVIIGMELEATERPGGDNDPVLRVDAESECYQVDATGAGRLGPAELE